VTTSDVAPTDAQPSMSQRLTALAQAVAVQEAVDGTVAALRAEVEETFKTDPDDAKSYNVNVPGVGKVATATRKAAPIADVTVVSEEKLTDWVALHHPTEVVRTLAIEIPDGFGTDAFRDAVLEALAPLRDVGAVLGDPREGREIRPAYRKALLKGRPNLKTGKLEEVDKSTGAVREVDGVAVAAPAPSGRFVLGQFDLDAKAEVRQQLAKEHGASTLARLLGARPATAPAEVTDSRVVVGELVTDTVEGEEGSAS
jgi:hypothetical protein